MTPHFDPSGPERHPVSDRWCRGGGFLLLCSLLLPLSAPAEEKTTLNQEERIIHVLNRLGYGPRPGDVERVHKIGLEAYIQQQLHPGQIPDAAVETKLARFETLGMDADKLVADFYAEVRRFVEKQRADGKADEMKTQYGLDIGGKPDSGAKSESRDAAGKLTRGLEFMKDLPSRASLRAVGELQTAKIVRAVESERQLQEVLVDFWSNHFNIDVKKGPCRVLKVVDEREVIRPHVLGKFRDLLGASAKSPAMLHYLDNVLNSTQREMSPIEQEFPRQVPAKAHRGQPGRRRRHRRPEIQKGGRPQRELRP